MQDQHARKVSYGRPMVAFNFGLRATAETKAWLAFQALVAYIALIYKEIYICVRKNKRDIFLFFLFIYIFVFSQKRRAYRRPFAKIHKGSHFQRLPYGFLLQSVKQPFKTLEVNYGA